MKPRAHIDYSKAAPMRPDAVIEGAVEVSWPVAGFYRFRLRSDGVRAAIKVFYGPPNDPVTDEPLDRSPRWQCLVNGEYFDDFDRIWPACARDPISLEEYNFMLARQDWAKRHAPQSGFADPRKKHDLFDINTPMPF